MDALWKGLLGGVVTALIVVASKRGNVLPGIFPLARRVGALTASVLGGSRGIGGCGRGQATD